MNIETANEMKWAAVSVWIECDRCGRAFGGPGVELSIQSVQIRRRKWNLCTGCQEALNIREQEQAAA
jgi:hypothetical protein